MPAISASAPGKIILFGEHAVVYDRPAIAAPVLQVRARAVVTPEPGRSSGEVLIDAPEVGLHSALQDLPEAHPLRLLVDTVRERLGAERLPALRLRITSTIPVAAGLGSGAAVSVAAARALAGFVGRPFSTAQVSEIAYIVEQAHHGTPSGIDNTVIAYAQPVYFQRGSPIEYLYPARPFSVVIADSGLQSPTAAAVGDVRQQWQANPARYEAIFDAVAGIVQQARQAIEHGPLDPLGELMTANHSQLQAMGVSCPELDRLVDAALSAGAEGAKLSGGGRGGNMIALVTADTAPRVEAALTAAGAVRTIVTTVQPAAREEA